MHKFSILLQEKRNQTINILIKQLLYSIYYNCSISPAKVKSGIMSVVLNQTTCSVSHESINPSKHKEHVNFLECCTCYTSYNYSTCNWLNSGQSKFQQVFIGKSMSAC